MYSSFQREPRFATQWTNMRLNLSQRCPECKKNYVGVHSCKVPCLYCHDFHSKKDLIENMCPIMYPLAKKEQQKHSLMCKNCMGEGCYTEQVQKVKHECNRKYQERLKQWQQSNQLQQKQGKRSSKPKRRVLEKIKAVNQVQCSDCMGQGKIFRFISCCAEGCRNCNWDKFLINPIWEKYRKQPIQNTILFNCPICLMDVEQGAQKYALDCKHDFHPDCIFKWMQTKKNCPVCRRTDCYLQGIRFESDLQENREQNFHEQDSDRIHISIQSDQDSFFMY